MALNECNEWGQVYILDYLTRYNPKDEKETEMVIDRVIPRLSHINPAVVFGSIKLMVRYLDFLSNEDLVKNLCKKIGPSLVSLVEMNKPEIQYVLLKNIQYIM
jgi:vesicle coat complex subunit